MIISCKPGKHIPVLPYLNYILTYQIKINSVNFSRQTRSKRIEEAMKALDRAAKTVQELFRDKISARHIINCVKLNTTDIFSQSSIPLIGSPMRETVDIVNSDSILSSAIHLFSVFGISPEIAYKNISQSPYPFRRVPAVEVIRDYYKYFASYSNDDQILRNEQIHYTFVEDGSISKSMFVPGPGSHEFPVNELVSDFLFGASSDTLLLKIGLMPTADIERRIVSSVRSIALNTVMTIQDLEAKMFRKMSLDPGYKDTPDYENDVFVLGFAKRTLGSNMNIINAIANIGSRVDKLYPELRQAKSTRDVIDMIVHDDDDPSTLRMIDVQDMKQRKLLEIDNQITPGAESIQKSE